MPRAKVGRHSKRIAMKYQAISNDCIYFLAPFAAFAFTSLGSYVLDRDES